MICETCRYNNQPGFIHRGGQLEPCRDCGGTRVAHCCDGLTACNDPEPSFICSQMDADAADEDRYQDLAAGVDETDNGATLH